MIKHRLTSRTKFPLLIAATLLTSCAPSTEVVSTPADSHQGGDPSIADDFEPRSPDSFILGEPTSDGACLPTIIDTDHSKNTAHFRYNGQPGDKITLVIVMDDGSVQKEQFELGSHHTGWQVPTTIENNTIDHVTVEASGRVGKPGSCTIAVN